MTYQANINCKKIVVAVLISDKIEFECTNHFNRQSRILYADKRTTEQKGTAIINIY